MKLIKLSLFCWMGFAMGASSATSDDTEKTISVKLSNGLDGTITIPALHGLVLKPQEKQDVKLPLCMAQLSFLYTNDRHDDMEVQHAVELHLSELLNQAEVALVPDKDAGVILQYNGLQLFELNARRRRSEKHSLQAVASVDRVRRSRKKPSKQHSLQHLK